MWEQKKSLTFFSLTLFTINTLKLYIWFFVCFFTVFCTNIRVKSGTTEFHGVHCAAARVEQTFHTNPNPVYVQRWGDRFQWHIKRSSSRRRIVENSRTVSQQANTSARSTRPANQRNNTSCSLRHAHGSGLWKAHLRTTSFGSISEQRKQ